MSTVTYTATITLTGGGINIVPGQTQSGEPASMLVGSFLKGDQGDRGYEGLGIFRTPEAATVQTTSLTKATVIVPQGRTIQAGSLVLSGSLCFQVSAVGDAVLTVTYVCDLRGLQGVPGSPGAPGTPGVSPAVTISKAGGVTTITITDSSGSHVATINDGSDATVTKAAVEAVLTGLISTHSHTVTKSDVGLGNVPNTNFTSRIEALEGKTDLADFAEDATHRTVTDVEKTKLAGLSNYDDTEVRGDISSIEAVIPDTATVSNKLADQAFVNSSIATNAATFRGNVTAADDTEAAAQTALATIAIKDNNDYANVVVPGTPNAGVDKYKRYTFNGTVWSFNYAINTSGFTAAQWAAINSGATAEVIAAIAGKYVKPSGGIPSSDMADDVQTSLGKANTAIQSHQSLAAYRPSANQDLIDATFEKSLIAGSGITLSAPDPVTGKRTISADEQDMETVVITVGCEDVSVSTVGVSVTKTEDGQSTVYNSDAQSQVSFRVRRGHQFTLSYGALGAWNPPATATYTASMPQRNITALYRGLSAVCWGVKINQTMSNPARELVGDRSLWTAWQNKIGRYLLKNDGSARKLKADDSTKYADGTAVDETEGHVMVRIPEFYYKVVDNSDGTCTLWGSESNFSGAYHVGEQWIGAYLGAVVSNALVSRSGINPTRSLTIDAFHLRAKHNGNDFGLTDYLHRQIMMMLFMWKYCSTNSQDPTLLGYGMTGSGSNWTTEVQAELTGRTASLGDACGGVAFTATGALASHVSLYGIEDPFGWFWEMIQGVYFGSSANAPAQDGTEIIIYDGNRMPSATELVSEPEGNFRKLTRLTTSGYPKILPLVDRFDLFASQYGGGTASNWYDYCYASATGQLLVFGGSALLGSRCGLVVAHSNYGRSYSDSHIGARLAFYGNVTIDG